MSMVRVGPTLVGQTLETANARSVDRAELFHVGPLPASHVTAGAGPKLGSKTASVDSSLPRGGPYMHCIGQEGLGHGDTRLAPAAQTDGDQRATYLTRMLPAVLLHCAHALFGNGKKRPHDKGPSWR